jgi:hypothetical protein
MKASDKIFMALALSHKGVEMTQQGKSCVFEYTGHAFAKLDGNETGVLKLGITQHAALLALCPANSLGADQEDGWSCLHLTRLDVPLLADYIGAAYRTVAPKVRLSF